SWPVLTPRGAPRSAPEEASGRVGVAKEQIHRWSAVDAPAALGALPLGAAFFVWDIGVKRGDIQVLGAASYLAPLLSTGFLVADGQAVLTWQVALAAVLMTGGAVIA
ncbi:hypothetical protein J8J27_25015, partial [Mycobacterium tuberculosis]|nr:hypothetical protein [Mycobacterium tuberculosis]